MKIRSKEQFVDLIDKEMVWRKKELSYLKGNVKENSPYYKTHLRSAIVMLYAHYEGFVKNSCELYLTYVKSQKLDYQELTENFIALSLKYNLTEFQQTNKSTLHCQLVDFLLNKLNQRAAIPNDNVIKTGSNLNSNILREVLTTIGLDYSSYELKNNLIDGVLLKNRNSIAHGEYLELNEVNFNELYSEIFFIMEDLKNRITNFVILESYKRTVPNQGAHPTSFH
jgi:MAE_28990/MAE_18760-like HEPN